jgi:hypothetical protein
MLDVEHLLPGDVIFSTERAAESFLIRLGTRSPYSHAAIYLGHAQYAEAVGLGVRVRAVSTIVNEIVRVSRLRWDLGIDSADIAHRAADRVNAYLHSPNWTQGAILSVFRRAKVKERRGLFCSHLVAKVYSDSGIDVLDGYEPLKVTPGRLAKSKKFVDVTATTTYTPAHIPAHLVQSNFVTLSDQETARQEGIYQDLVPFFEARAIAVPNDWIKMLVIRVRISCWG